MVKVRRNRVLLVVSCTAAAVVLWGVSRISQEMSHSSQSDTRTSKHPKSVSLKEHKRHLQQLDLERHWNLVADPLPQSIADQLLQLPDSFHIDQPFSLPVPFATLPISILLQQQWVKDLQRILANTPKSQRISVVSSDFRYRDVLLNWLVAAKTKLYPPLADVIVFSLDAAVCELLNKRSINCVYAAMESFFTKFEVIANLKGVVFTEILVLRITAIRLMNHWGYDVANYDTDAIILKNPESLYSKYKDSDMVASYGTFPFELKDKWGATMCGGVFMVRSTPRSEHFWEAVSRVNITSTMVRHNFDDQARLNYGLEAMRPSWGDPRKRRNFLNDEHTGVTPNGFKVTIASGREICRHYCNIKDRSRYYIWHKGGGPNDTKQKVKYAEEGKLWFLRKDWEAKTNSSSSVGENWLKEISVKSI